MGRHLEATKRSLPGEIRALNAMLMTFLIVRQRCEAQITASDPSSITSVLPCRAPRRLLAATRRAPLRSA